MEAASGDLAMFAERAMDASKGAGEGAELFKELGVSVKGNNGQLKSQEQLFNETITALQGMEDVTKRNALATATLGTTGEELAPVLNMSNKELERMKGNANVIPQDQINKAKEFKTSWQTLKSSLGGVALTIGASVLPALQGIVDKVNTHMPTIKQIMETALSGLGTAFQKIGTTGKSVFQSIKQFIQDNMPTIQMVKDSVLQLGDGLKTAFEKAKPTLMFLKDEALPAVGDAIFKIVEKAIQLKDFIVNNWSVIGPLVTGIVIAFGAWKTAIVVQTAVTKTMTTAQKLLNIAMRMNPMGLIITLIGLLIGAGILLYKNWDKVKEKAGELWSSIKKFFGNIWDKTKEIWDNVKSKIGSALESAGESVSNFFSPLMDFIDKVKGKWDDFTSALSNFSLPGAVKKAGEFIGGAVSKVGGWVGADGSHANGLDRVPFDGYKAILHKGETVLPKKEAEAYRNGGTTQNNSSTNNTFNITINSHDTRETATLLVNEIQGKLANM